MTVLYLHRFFRTLVAGVIVVGGFTLAGPPVAASTAAPQLAGAICGTKAILGHAAPGVGKSATFTLPTAGSVTLLEQSTTSLMVTSAKPASGWKATIVTASGTPVLIGAQPRQIWQMASANASVPLTILFRSSSNDEGEGGDGGTNIGGGGTNIGDGGNIGTPGAVGVIGGVLFVAVEATDVGASNCSDCNNPKL